MYAEMVADGTAVQRIRTLTTLRLIWWVARFAKAQYDIQGTFEKRLVQPPSGWAESMLSKYQHYLNLALTAV